MAQLNFQKNPQKIAIFGLGNAGKTSIIKMIMYEFDAFANLLPTTGVDRTEMDFFGKSLLLWDFGGQEIYRKDYLAQPMRYFQQIKFFYYVVDCQDVKKIPESAEYFLKLLDLTKEYSDNFKIFIYFHKIDPNYKGSVNFEEIENNFLNEVLPKISDYNLIPTVFYTSIYNPLSVISAFSQPLLGNETIYNTLSEAIDGFCWNQGFDFGMLFVQNFEIGCHFSDKQIIPEITKKITKYLEQLDDFEECPPFRIGSYEIYTKNFAISVGENNFFFHFSIGIKILNVPDDNDDDDIFDSLDEFTYDLRKILQNSELIRSGELRAEEIKDGMNEIERNYLKNEEEKLSGLEENDIIQDNERDLELELIDDIQMEKDENDEN